MRTRAPGKVFLGGEYAVLHGAPALVAAVSRYAVADTAGPPSTRPEVVALARALGAPPPDVDVSALSLRGRKLGLGSSAAALVAAAAAILGDRGVDLTDPSVRTERLESLVAVHRAAQGQAGSGGDVAAALFGGVLAFRALPTLSVVPFSMSSRWAIVLADTGVTARTAPLARAALAVGIPPALEVAATALMDALCGSDSGSLARAVDLHLQGMADLATSMGVPLLSPPVQRVIDVAVAHGVPAKPAGAGAGDLVVAFAGDLAQADAVVAALSAKGLWAERAVLDGAGVLVGVP